MLGDTSLSEPFSDNPSGCMWNNEYKAEFYKIRGTGSCIMVEIESTEFQPQIAFFTGSCSDLQCYHSTELSEQAVLNEQRNSTLIPTEVGIDYTVAVVGLETGNYSITFVRISRDQVQSKIYICQSNIFSCLSVRNRLSSSPHKCRV